VRYGVSVPSRGFVSVQQAYREAALFVVIHVSEPADRRRRPVGIECSLIGATATTKAIVASKGNKLRALSDDDRVAAVVNNPCLLRRQPQRRKAAERMHVHPNTCARLQQIATKTGHDPRTFTASSTCSASRNDRRRLTK